MFVICYFILGSWDHCLVDFDAVGNTSSQGYSLSNHAENDWKVAYLQWANRYEVGLVSTLPASTPRRF